MTDDTSKAARRVPTREQLLEQIELTGMDKWINRAAIALRDEVERLEQLNEQHKKQITAEERVSDRLRADREQHLKMLDGAVRVLESYGERPDEYGGDENLVTCLEKVCEERSLFHRELAEAKKDTARLDWLETNLGELDIEYYGGVGDSRDMAAVHHNGTYIKDTLREAIDAAKSATDD